MKKLGLLGGMAPESTIPYYHDIVYGVREKMGNECFPTLTIESVSIFEILDLCKDEKYDELVEYLLQGLKNLAAGGADFAALSANTPHIVFDKLKEKSPIPLISIIDTARDVAVKQGFAKIGLLGTIFTMQGDFFKTPFEEAGIKVVIPTDDEMALINEKLSRELELGIVKKETLTEFQKIIKRMKRDDGIEAIVLGCTELPLILNDEASPVPCLDTMKIHIQALIDKIIDKD